MASVFDKYGVPNSSGEIEAAIQPKLQYRFKVSFIDIGGISDSFSLTKNIVNTTIPNFNQEDQQIDSYVSRYYVLGKHNFETFNITFRNDAANNVAGIIQSQIDRQHNSFEQSNAPTAGGVKFNTKILFLDGRTGDDVEILEGWHVTGCWITSVDWGSLDYGTGEPNQISVTIRPDNAFHIVDEGSLGDEEAVSYTASTAATDSEFQANTDDDISAV